MRIPRLLYFALAAALIAAPAAAQAITLQVQVKLTRMKSSHKHGVTAAEKKNPKLLMNAVEQKVLDTRMLHPTMGASDELKLPNGTLVVVTPTAWSGNDLKVHVRALMQGKTGYESDFTAGKNRPFFVMGGPYNEGILMVWFTPRGE